jgi:hypothetical protein
MIRTMACEESVQSALAGPAAGERALMRAVLEDAVQCLAGEIGPRQERPQLAVEAREWFLADDTHWPFSFANVCDALGFDIDRLRAQVLRDAPEIAPVESASIAPSRPRREVPSEQQIVQMIRDGNPLRVVAETFGISVSKASILSCGLASRMKSERDDEIRRMRDAGWTYRTLAARFSLSRIRVMRICARRIREETRSAA